MREKIAVLICKKIVYYNIKGNNKGNVIFTLTSSESDRELSVLK